MASIENFDKEFVERTLDILDRNIGNEKYDVTLLLNCLLGLVTLPIEREKDDIASEKFKDDCVSKMKNLCEYIKVKTNDKIVFNNIRNSIAHLHIEVENSPYVGKIDYIILRNAKDNNDYKQGKYNLVIKISVNNLREFAKYVATEYLKNFFE